MTLKECYAAMGADYDAVLGRLRKEDRILKYLLKFLDDPSFETLRQSLAAGNVEEAFRAAHTLKGVGQNLSLDRIYTTSSTMAEILRGGSLEGTAPLMEQLEADYALAAELIRGVQTDG